MLVSTFLPGKQFNNKNKKGVIKFSFFSRSLRIFFQMKWVSSYVRCLSINFESSADHQICLHPNLMVIGKKRGPSAPTQVVIQIEGWVPLSSFSSSSQAFLKVKSTWNTNSKELSMISLEIINTIHWPLEKFIFFFLVIITKFNLI